MPDRYQILVLTDSRSSAPAEVEPMMGIQQFMAESRAAWEIHWEKHCPESLARGGRRFAGIIGRATPRIMQLAARSRIPMVNIWSSAAPTRVPSVIADFEAAGRMAAEYFLDRGLRRAAFLGTARRFSDRLRHGFVERLAADRVPCLSETTAWGYEDTAARFGRFTRRVHGLVERLRSPVGILGFEDTACRYIAYACEERGLRIPDDVAIMGVTNNVLACMQPSPSLSSVDCNFPLVGYKAAELLAALMTGTKPPREPILVPPRTIVPRRSTEHVFTDDPLVAEALLFIAARRAGRLRPRDVAHHVAASERTLQRRFHEAVAHSIVHEIIRQRVRHARQLLLDGDLLLKQIAKECGFQNARRLGLEFQKREGMSPTAYRRLHRGSP
jgi:LacI family transcriptional regulator